MHKILAFAAIAACAIGLAVPAHAIDCGTASQSVEHDICADPALKLADQRLNDVYQHLLRSREEPERIILRDLQREWVSARDDCERDDGVDHACVRDRINRRTAFLLGADGQGSDHAGRLSFTGFEDKTGEAAYSVSAYRFTAPATAGERLFNSQVDGVIAAARKVKADDARSRGKGEPCDECGYRARMGQPFQTAGFISAPLDSEACEGGAHCSGEERFINVNLKRAKLVTFDDYVLRAKARRVVKACYQQVMASDTDGQLNLASGRDAHGRAVPSNAFSRAFEDTSTWAFTGKAIEVHFGFYVLGPYVAGWQSCRLPYSVLTPSLRPGVSLPR